ncbi:Uncharacterized protein PBTT_03111 [Plasmodiophora brassicae]
MFPWSSTRQPALFANGSSPSQLNETPHLNRCSAVPITSAPEPSMLSTDVYPALWVAASILAWNTLVG